MRGAGTPDRDTETLRTVVIAVTANLLVTVAKGAAALVTHSAALTAETAHSLADTGNELLLFVGVRHGRLPSDDRHPFGHGQAGYFWSLLAAIGIFLIGGVFAIVDGVRSLQRPEPLANIGVGVAVLLASAVLEGVSWLRAREQLREGARVRRLDFARFLATTSDPMPRTVFFEDTAALVGVALALAALGLHVLTGSPLWDGAASLAIGALLVVVAFQLVRRNVGFLIDQSAPPDIRERLRAEVAAEPWVLDVPLLQAVFIGPRRLLVIVHVVPAEDAGLTERVRRLRERLLTLPGVTAVEVTPVHGE